MTNQYAWLKDPAQATELSKTVLLQFSPESVGPSAMEVWCAFLEDGDQVAVYDSTGALRGSARVEVDGDYTTFHITLDHPEDNA